MPCPYDLDYGGVDMILPPMTPVKGVYTEEQMHHIRMIYAEKLTLCDKYFGKLCDCIRELGMWENTLMWLCSDHGEPMGNGEHGHGLMTKCRPWPYEELVHIPLIIKAPGLEPGKRIKAFVQDCDCAPTILDWLGIAIPETMTGKSLLPLCRGEVKEVRDFAIAGYYDFSWSIITEDWSYIHWLQKKPDDEDSSLAALNTLYNNAFVKHLKAEDQENAAKMKLKADAAAGMSSEELYEKQRALDDTEQWTCTPGSKAEVPASDELYDRREDPFQLHNVIADYPEIAAGLLARLNAFMADLATM